MSCAVIRSLKLKTTLRQGTVYKMSDYGLTSALPHFFIVLNLDPCSDEIIVLTVFTSKIENQRKRVSLIGANPETLVEISPEEYSVLKKNSVVNCNAVFVRQTEYFEKKVLNPRDAEPCKDIPEAVLEKIIRGVLLSNTVDDEIKRKIAPR